MEDFLVLDMRDDDTPAKVTCRPYAYPKPRGQERGECPELRAIAALFLPWTQRQSWPARNISVGRRQYHRPFGVTTTYCEDIRGRCPDFV